MTCSSWLEEAELIDFDERSIAVANAAEWSEELWDASLEAHSDPQYEQLHDEWLDHLTMATEPFGLMLLGIEQSCHEGILLPWDMRAVRLWSAPPELLTKLHTYWRLCPWYIAELQSYSIYWLVRAGRGRRSGRPDWSPKG